ncbi:glutathione-disulfide reductase [Lysobacteraceae bacterium NML08-0793]|nr:glutathione-disulfide reductase [Xanthomonadaceae bacterium NML08-0793]
MNTNDFDLIVLGGGSGGLAAAIRAARYGAQVAMLEPGLLGGTCVNIGCVPKKAMWLAADLAEKIAIARQLGFDLHAQPALDWSRLLGARTAYIERIHVGYGNRLSELGVTVIPAFGKLTGNTGEVIAGDTILHGRHVLIATGSRPLRPDIPGAALGGVSDDFFGWQQAPGRVAIVGGGYIGVELAGVLQALGSQVTLLVRQPRLLANFDADISTRLAEVMRQHGIDLRFETAVAGLEKVADGIQARTEAGVVGCFDALLFATGREPNSRGIGLEAAGVVCNGRGQIEVDAWQNTSVFGVYAVGDVTPQPALTPHAVAASRRLMDRLFADDKNARVDFAAIPTVVFSHPPMAAMGLSEAEARNTYGDDVAVARSEFRPMLGALADKPEKSLFKVIYRRSDERVLGIHLLGEGSDEILQGFAVAMQMGMRLADLRATLAIHPTSAEEVVLAQ